MAAADNDSAANTIMATRNLRNGAAHRDLLTSSCASTAAYHPDGQGKCDLSITCSSPSYDTKVDCCKAQEGSGEEYGFCMSNKQPTIDCGSGTTYDKSWTDIAALREGTNDLTDDPDYTSRLTDLLQVPSNAGDSYGARISGWLLPPVTGEYTFWIAADDNGEFWLSTDADETNKVLQCKVSYWVSPLSFDASPEQKSVAIKLVGGKAYYYELRLCFVLLLLVPPFSAF